MVDILSPEDHARLAQIADLVWDRDEPPKPEQWRELLADVDVVASGRAILSADDLANAPRLHTVIDLAGGPPRGIDYPAAFARGIRVLTCSPAFGREVAEMTLALALAGGRGIVREHEAMRQGNEIWRHQTDFDFTLHGQTIGLVGFGAIAQALVRLLAPFRCRLLAYDPWLPDSMIADLGGIPAGIDTLMSDSRVVCVLAPRTTENRHLIDARRLAAMSVGALLLVVSRSHLVDLAALEAELRAGRIQAAIDVYEVEPLPADHSLRSAPNLILSSHRAGGISSAMQTIGRMLVEDMELISRGLPPRRMLQIQPETVARFTTAT